MLTKQIENIQQQVVQKEQQIRSLAREAYEAKTVSQARPSNEKVATKIESSPVIRTEHLGLVTLKAVEAPRRDQLNETKSTPEKVEKTKPQKIETLSRSELLLAAAEVSVGATNLRRVFETNLISEHGLRRLLQEHERGGNVRESLERELVEKEMSYERDPRLRNRSVMGSLAASKVVRADIDKIAPPVSQVSDDSTQTARAINNQSKTSNTPSAAVAAVVTLTVVIAVLLVILFTSR